MRRRAFGWHWEFWVGNLVFWLDEVKVLQNVTFLSFSNSDPSAALLIL